MADFGMTMLSSVCHNVVRHEGILTDKERHCFKQLYQASLIQDAACAAASRPGLNLRAECVSVQLTHYSSDRMKRLNSQVHPNPPDHDKSHRWGSALGLAQCGRQHSRQTDGCLASTICHSPQAPPSSLPCANAGRCAAPLSCVHLQQKLSVCLRCAK